MSATTRFTPEELSELKKKKVVSRFIFFPLGFLVIWCNYTCWPVEELGLQSPWIRWSVQSLWIVTFGYLMLCWTSCFHETAHQTLTTKQWVNILIGRLLGTIVGVPYTVYRESHIRHHAYLNSPRDWELWPYSDPDVSLKFRRVFVWIDLFFGIVTAPITYGRLFFHKDSPLQSPSVRKTIWKEYFFIVLLWGSVLGAVAYFGAWKTFLIMWFLPHLVAGFLQNCRKLTEHLGMSSYDPLQGTRTVMSESWLTRLGNYLNFDIFIHGPHHRHPKVPHDKLQEKMEDYQAKHPTLTYPVFNSYLSATWNMLPSMWRCPGVGINAGSHDEKKDAEDVQDFVADVIRDLPSNQYLEQQSCPQIALSHAESNSPIELTEFSLRGDDNDSNRTLDFEESNNQQASRV